MSGIDAPVGVAAGPASDNSNLHDATRVFSKSVMISGIRCTLAYVIFPFLLPLLHVSDSVGPYIGLVIGAVAIWFNILSIRRFWKSGHQWKWYMSALNVAVIIMLSILFLQDVNTILS